MKYLTILDNLEIRGSQRVAQNYCIGMKNLGHEVQVLTIDGLGIRANFLENEEITCSCLKLDKNAFKSILHWSPDLVHIHRPGIYNKEINQLIINLKDNINPLIFETNIFSRVDYQIPPGYIDLHLHLTEWCLWKWLQWSKVLKYKPLATVLPNSIITDVFYRSTLEDIIAIKQKIGIPKDDFIFGRVGANCEAKWHPIIVDGFEQVAKQRNNISLILVAPPASIQEQVKNLPSKLRNKVFIMPTVTDDSKLRLLYSTMDVMLHAARIGESFGIVLAESLLCETSIITLSSPTKDNSQVEIVEHNKTGIVVNNQKAFINAMIEVSSNRPQVARFGRYGRISILDKFDNSQICFKLDLLCNLVLKNRDRPYEALSEILNSNGFTTEINQRKILKKIETFNGEVPIYDKLIARLVHQPVLYKLYASSLLFLKHTYFSKLAK